MSKRKIKIGLDFDGVVAYNPMRIFRPIIVLVKKKILRVKSMRFIFPEAKWQQFIWKMLHDTSVFPANGSDMVKDMDKDLFEFHLVTARYSFLDDHLDKWLKKYKLKKYFMSINMNMGNEQPHIFKEKMVNKLKLDYFIEDNWDIVNFLDGRVKTKIYWIYNILDRNIIYKKKFPFLKRALADIQQIVIG